MKLTAIVIAVFVLASCGADGPPVRPSLNAGITLSAN